LFSSSRRILQVQFGGGVEAGETIRGVAVKFNVNPSTVQRIKHPFAAVAA
jgi:hypothetical protein